MGEGKKHVSDEEVEVKEEISEEKDAMKRDDQVLKEHGQVGKKKTAVTTKKGSSLTAKGKASPLDMLQENEETSSSDSDQDMAQDAMKKAQAAINTSNSDASDEVQTTQKVANSLLAKKTKINAKNEDSNPINKVSNKTSVIVPKNKVPMFAKPH